MWRAQLQNHSAGLTHTHSLHALSPPLRHRFLEGAETLTVPKTTLPQLLTDEGVTGPISLLKIDVSIYVRIRCCSS